ncbi:VWA domain-containing protein [Candidatus Saccharibacteria bacterium]|nr:VWA domain-containing protein [Candidatus Saccharibacteria bacterium]
MSLGFLPALLILLIPVALVFWRRLRRPARRPQFVADSTSLSKIEGYQKTIRRARRLRRVEYGLLAVMMVLCALLVARPQIPVKTYNPEYSRDIVLCLDVSGSMEPYVAIALDALDNIYKQNPTDRYSIVVFASRAVTVLPLTRDPVAINQKIELLRDVYQRDNDPNYQFRDLPGYGTDVGEGVLASVQRFDDLKTQKTRNIILVSDLDQTSGDYDPDGTSYLKKVGLVPQNRINMFVMQPPLEYEYASAPQQILAVSGALNYPIDKDNPKESGKEIMDQIFAQVLNTRTVVSAAAADFPYYVIAGLALTSGLWTGVVLWRWRQTA